MCMYMCVYIVQSLHFKTKEYYDFKLITHAFIIIVLLFVLLFQVLK